MVHSVVRQMANPCYCPSTTLESVGFAGVSSERAIGYGCLVSSAFLLAHSVLKLRIVSLTDFCFD